MEWGIRIRMIGRLGTGRMGAIMDATGAVEKKGRERLYRVVLWCLPPGRKRFKWAMLAKGKTAGEARLSAMKSGKRLWGSCEIKAGGVKWQRC